jgi:hypothetical protein
VGRWHPASPSPLNCSAWPLPPQELHGTPLPGLVAGQATKRTSWWRNISGASGGTTQTAGMLWRYSPAAMVRDSVEGLTTRPHRAPMPRGPGQLEQQVLIDAQRIGRIG